VTDRPSAEVFIEALRPIVAELVDEALARHEHEHAPTEWLTVEEYAAARKTTAAAVRQRALRGQVPGAFKDGARWLLPSRR
jgi:hypothetical protein